MRLAFVTPRYGPDILGGAEALARGFAEKLAQKGWPIEVWTTCAQNYYTWQNMYPVGVETINRVTVRRFPASVMSTPGSNGVGSKVFGNFPSTPEAEYRWADGGMHSPELYHYLLHYGRNFDYLIFLPYQFGFTCYGASIYPEHSIIWPCLHPDPAAYFEPVRVMLHQAKGIILNSQAERRLLLQGLQIKNLHYQVIGYGVEASPGDSNRFYRHYPHLKTPFMLYAGRIEKAKNVHLLIDYFIAYVETRRNPINLVLIGSGPVSVPNHPRVFWLGHLNEQDKHDAYASAAVLCQPSVLESFGITLMEAWRQATPVLVHGECGVTLEHCLAAQGGLYFADLAEFKEVLDFLLANPEIAAQLGRNGCNYVETNYSWDRVVKKLTDSLASWSNT